MTYFWRASFGTWVLRPAKFGQDWVLVWYDRGGSAVRAAHYPSLQQAVEAVYQKKTGVREWDAAIGMAERLHSLEAWDRAEQFPQPSESPLQ
jgi:hypothetical protein